VLIRRRAAKMRKQLAEQRLASATSSSGQVDREKLAEEDEYEYRYTARSEVGKVKFAAAMRTSLLRPLRESTVTKDLDGLQLYLYRHWRCRIRVRRVYDAREGSVADE
jgi:hypothetical protein